RRNDQLDPTGQQGPPRQPRPGDLQRRRVHPARTVPTHHQPPRTAVVDVVIVGNSKASAPEHAEHSVSPGSNRANLLHLLHRVWVTPLAITPDARSTLCTVYS